MKDENLENTLITLHGRGWSIRKIARELGVSRKRIRRVLLSNMDSRDNNALAKISSKKPRASKLDPW